MTTDIRLIVHRDLEKVSRRTAFTCLGPHLQIMAFFALQADGGFEIFRKGRKAERFMNDNQLWRNETSFSSHSSVSWGDPK
jgi:hypothetical protein